MTIPSEILELWQQNYLAAFPDGYGGREIDGLNLPLMDAEIAGCIRMNMPSAALDPQRVKTLYERLADLNSIVLLLDSDQLMYFNRLGILANLVLQEVGS